MMDKMADGLPEFKIKGYGRIKVDGTNFGFKIRDYVDVQQSDYPGKRVVLQDIKFGGNFPDTKNQVRVCFYIIGKKGRTKGKWTWGHVAPFILKEDFEKLVKKARKKGIL